MNIGIVGQNLSLSLYHGPDDFSMIEPSVIYEGKVYMSHGCSLSLPDPHDTVG